MNMNLTLTVMLLHLLASLARATTRAEKCAAYVNSTICDAESATTASWCSHRNPYLLPRFLTQKDASTLEKLSKLASPICELNQHLGESVCYMFSRFFASMFQGKPLFIANVVTNDTDTNRLLLIDGLSYEEIPGLAPDVQLGARYGDIDITDAPGAGDINYLGVSVTVNPQKFFMNNNPRFEPKMTPTEIIRDYAYRYSGIYVTEQDPLDKDSWKRYGYLSFFSDFVSVNSPSASLNSSLVNTNEAGWWIYPDGKPTYVSLTKHSDFDIFRIKFVPGDYDDALDGIQIWELDREPVDHDWASANCPETDLPKLKQLIMDQPACKVAEYPKAPHFLKTCPSECRALYNKYFHNRKCFKYVFDKVRFMETPSNYAVRAFIASGHKCHAEGYQHHQEKSLKLKFVQQSYGCNLDQCHVRAGEPPFPEDGAELEARKTCGNRTRTLVALQTETSVSIMQYDPPDPIKQPVPVTECSHEQGWECPLPEKEELCPSPCINRARITKDSFDQSWIGLGNRLKKISVEEVFPTSETMCSSCNGGGRDGTDAPKCVHFPEKVLVTPSLHTIEIFSSKTIDEKLMDPATTTPSSGDATILDLTQQLWMMVASHPAPSRLGTHLDVYELTQFGNMSSSSESSVTSCNPVGDIKFQGRVPLTSKPVTLRSYGGETQTTQIQQMVYAHQGYPKQLKATLKAENCSCALTDRLCHIRQAAKDAQKLNGGGSTTPDISQLGQLGQVEKMEMFTHIVHVSTNDRRMIVVYLNEIYNDCTAELIQAQGHGNDISIILPRSGQPSSNSLAVDIVNEVPLAGRAQYIDFTPNGMFSFVTMTRLESEKESYSRAAEMCRLLKKDPGNPFLTPYTDACAESGSKKPRDFSILDFVQVASFCPPGSYCPSMLEYDISTMPDGYYSNYGFDQVSCEPGTFCPQGVQQDCPIGFTCPRSTMKTPLPCRIDGSKSTNCFAKGLKAPQTCEHGQICYTPYMPGLPSPPGQKVGDFHGPPSTHASTYRKLVDCTVGEYCSLGRDVENDTRCPPSTFCPSPDIAVPTNCTTPDRECLKKYCPGNLTCPDKCAGMTSCPAGSFKEVNCSAGEYCPDPRSGGNPCPDTSFCPVGTWNTPPPCPPGYFCPTPAEKILCPNHKFCPRGTTTPQRCGALDWCPPGSKEKRAGVWGLIFVAILPFAVWGIAVYAYKERDRKRSDRESARSLKTSASMGSRVSLSDLDLEMSRYQDASTNDAESKVYSTLNQSLLESHDESSSTGNARGSGAGGNLKRSSSTWRLSNLWGASHAAEDSEMDPEDFVDDVFAPRRFRVDFEFDKLGLKIKGSGKSVLDGVTGQIKSSHVTAVMGPSGAGKSTFVTTLAGKAYYGDPQGTIKINGKIRPLNDFKKVVGFVPQEDIMMRDLTVKENIRFSAHTRLPTDWSTRRKKRYSDATMQVLGLHEIRHSMIGDENTRGISGGQRKRVNIALEMVADPLVLFLDEPTSGLDSTSSMEVCDALRKIADIGLTVVTVLHQPRYEIFCQFHDVLLLGKGGRAVYLGPSEKALEYFESNGFMCPPRVNPPDYMMDVIAGNVSEEFRTEHPEWHQNDLFQMWIDHQKKQSETNGGGGGKDGEDGEDEEADADALPPHDESLESSVTERRQVSGCGLVWRFVKRSLVQQTRHWLDVAIDNGLLFFAALFMSYININIPWINLPPSLPPQCYVDVNNTPGLDPCGEYAQHGRLAIFGGTNFILIRGQMTVMAVGLCTCASSIKVFGRERVVYFREAAGLEQPMHSTAYFCGKDLSVIPQIILGPLLYCTIFVAMSASLGDFMGLYTVLLGTTFVSYSIGYIVSIVAPSSLAQLVGVVVVFCMSAFDGASPTLPNLHNSPPPLSWGFEHLSFLTPALKAFYDNEAEMWINTTKAAQIDMVDFAKENFGYDQGQYWVSILILFSWGIFFRIVGALVLNLKDKNKKL